MMTRETKFIRILTHSSAFFAPVLVPLLVFFSASERELKSLALQSCIFHLIMSLLIAISAFLSIVVIGIPFIALFSVIYVAVPVGGIITALRARDFQYPFVYKWINI